MIGDYLRDVIVARINDLFGEKLDTIFDLPRNYDELAVEIKERLVGDFKKYGMELADFYLNSITPPPEVQKMIDERSGLEAVGNLDSFFKFKAAKAMGDAAAAGGGDGAGSAAASGMGIGVGAGLGFMIPGMIAQSMKAPGIAVQGNDRVREMPRRGSGGRAFLRRMRRAGRARGEMRRTARPSSRRGAKFCASCGNGEGRRRARKDIHARSVRPLRRRKRDRTGPGDARLLVLRLGARARQDAGPRASDPRSHARRSRRGERRFARSSSKRTEGAPSRRRRISRSCRTR